jgi:hypothetical protein
VSGPKSGVYTSTCPVTGATITPNGWTFKASLCAVSGTFTSTAAFKTTLFADTSNPGTYDFDAVLKAKHPLVAIKISSYTVSCPLRWVGSNGLSWGARHIARNEYRLRVHNATARTHVVHCGVTYQTRTGTTRHVRWWPKIAAGVTARKLVSVHHVSAMRCTYTLRRKLSASG